MGEGPSLTTPRLTAVPLTMWNAGFVAAEIATALGDPGGPLDRVGGPDGPGGLGGPGESGSDDVGPGDPAEPEPAPGGRELTDLLRRDLRRRAIAGPEVLTWAIRDASGEVVGMLSSDTKDRRAVVTVSIARPRRRRGYATEALRAVANWIEAGRSAVVEARVRLGDVPSESLVRTTAFLPTEVFLQDSWRIWLRPPPP